MDERDTVTGAQQQLSQDANGGLQTMGTVAPPEQGLATLITGTEANPPPVQAPVDDPVPPPTPKYDIDPEPAGEGPGTWAEMKAWFRRELALHACGVSHDEREEMNP